MNIRKIELKIGLDKPIKLLLTGDNHLSYADERESDVEREHSKIRNIQYFSCGKGEDNLKNEFSEIVKYANENCDLLVMAGDVADHPAHLNLETVQKILAGANYIYAVGNHDYNNYSVERESLGLLKTRTATLEKAFGQKLCNHSVQYGGLNIVALQDVMYNFDNEAVEFIENELKRRLPMLLLFHIPLYAETLEADVYNYWKNPIMTGTPAEVYEKYGRTPVPVSDSTRKIIQMIGSEELICGVLAGHIHFAHEDSLPCGKPQIICEAGYLGSATEIHLS